jgi:hypothetical protein
MNITSEGKNLWKMMSTKKQPKAKSVDARVHHAAASDEFQSETAEEFRQSTHGRIT